MKKSKYQQYFHCFIIYILAPYVFWFSFQQNVFYQNIVTILISATLRGVAFIRGEALIRGRCLFQCGYPKVQHLLEASAYLGPVAYQMKYGIQLFMRFNGCSNWFSGYLLYISGIFHARKTLLKFSVTILLSIFERMSYVFFKI